VFSSKNNYYKDTQNIRVWHHSTQQLVITVYYHYDCDNNVWTM